MSRPLGPILLCLMIACSESFLPASAVTDLRVIGARIDVQGAPGRANPSPGDDVQASILVIDAPPLDQEEPALTPPELTWAFVACVPTATRIGVPICGTLIDACDGCIGPPPGDPFALPVIRFQVPSEEDLDAVEAREVLLQGVVCGEGSPSADAIVRFLSGETDDLAPCEGPDGQPIEHEEQRSVGRFVTVQIPIQRDAEDPNLNPEIGNVFLNGSEWPPPYAQEVPRTAPRTGCKADLDALSEEDRSEHPIAGSGPSTINLSVTVDSLQSFTIDGEDLTEEIQVSWLADGGGFEVAFSFITQAPPSILTQWQPFSEAPTDGRLIRFNFVVRDGRGGLDRVERGLCVLPPSPAESPP
ncbi:MAG: hypothetical protein WBB42_19030 [Polyangiales bacterium]